MSGKKHSFSPPTIGGSSLLVIFAVLCLTVFALLSLSTVQADGRLSEKTCSITESYYEADCSAEEILARIRQGQIPDGVSEDGNVYSYSVLFGDSQAIDVAVEVSGKDYSILRWQVVSAGEWVPDDSISVWDGE